MDKICDCRIHRYHVAHLCACGEIISHSQAAWDVHKFHGKMVTFDSRLYEHGDAPEDIRRKLDANKKKD